MVRQAFGIEWGETVPRRRKSQRESKTGVRLSTGREEKKSSRLKRKQNEQWGTEQREGRVASLYGRSWNAPTSSLGFPRRVLERNCTSPEPVVVHSVEGIFIRGALHMLVTRRLSNASSPTQWKVQVHLHPLTMFN